MRTIDYGYDTHGGMILVTGFMPFSHHERNISQELVEHISTAGALDYEVNTCILTVDENGSREISDRILGGEEIRALLHLGFSENADEILLEKFARNRYQMEIVDNSGRIETSGEISSGKPILETNAPIQIIDSFLEGVSGIRWNEDAGGFVCNETYYRSLLAATIKKSPIVLFMHLPLEEIIPFDQQFKIICLVCNAMESVINL
jgi:pyrrolidone-carboxylate peptidase